MSTRPYSFEPMSVEAAQVEARKRARDLNQGRYTALAESTPSHLMVDDTRPVVTKRRK